MVISEWVIRSIFDNDEFHVEQQYPDENDGVFWYLQSRQKENGTCEVNCHLIDLHLVPIFVQPWSLIVYVVLYHQLIYELFVLFVPWEDDDEKDQIKWEYL